MIQDKTDQNDRQPMIEDLPVEENQEADVKGGPIYLEYKEKISGSVTAEG